MLSPVRQSPVDAYGEVTAHGQLRRDADRGLGRHRDLTFVEARLHGSVRPDLHRAGDQAPDAVDVQVADRPMHGGTGVERIDDRLKPPDFHCPERSERYTGEHGDGDGGDGPAANAQDHIDRREVDARRQLGYLGERILDDGLNPDDAPAIGAQRYKGLLLRCRVRRHDGCTTDTVLGRFLALS